MSAREMQGRMAQVNTLLDIAELDIADSDELEVEVDQQRYFWQVRPAAIAHWTVNHKPELALLTGMALTSLVISGAAMAVLFSPNLGQTLTYDPLIDDATLAASRRMSLGEQLLGQVARVLEIEIIETQGPEVGRHSVGAPAMTIVAQADKAAPMAEADLALGLKAMVLATGVGLGVTGLMRWVPRIPLSAIGPRRRRPLSQRLNPADVIQRPLAPVTANPAEGRSQALIPGALNSWSVVEQIQPVREQAPTPKRAPGPVSWPLHISPGRRHKNRSKLPQAGAAQAHRPALMGEEVGQTLRSQPPSPPISFVPLSSFATTALIPAKQRSSQRQVLLPNPQPANPSSQLGKPTPGPFDFLDQLDMRRQYP